MSLNLGDNFMNLSDKGNHVSRVKMEYQLTGTYEAGIYFERHEFKTPIVLYPSKILEVRKILGKSIRFLPYLLSHHPTI